MSFTLIEPVVYKCIECVFGTTYKAKGPACFSPIVGGGQVGLVCTTCPQLLHSSIKILRRLTERLNWWCFYQQLSLYSRKTSDCPLKEASPCLYAGLLGRGSDGNNTCCGYSDCVVRIASERIYRPFHQVVSPSGSSSCVNSTPNHTASW